jgi:hypothetical protein
MPSLRRRRPPRSQRTAVAAPARQNTVGRTAYMALSPRRVRFYRHAGRPPRDRKAARLGTLSHGGQPGRQDVGVAVVGELREASSAATDYRQRQGPQTVHTHCRQQDVSFNGLLYTKDATGKANFLWAARSADLLLEVPGQRRWRVEDSRSWLPRRHPEHPAGSHDDVALPAPQSRWHRTAKL